MKGKRETKWKQAWRQERGRKRKRKEEKNNGEAKGKGEKKKKHGILSRNSVPLIQSEVVVVVDQDQPDSLTLRYTRTPVQSSKFDLYRFRISDSRNTTKQKMVDDVDTKVTFTGLTPGKLYNVTVWTVSDNVESRPLLRQDRLCEYSTFRSVRGQCATRGFNLSFRLISKRVKKKKKEE